MTTQRTPDGLLARIRDGNRFLITSHLSPDGDAIGSALGLARVIRTLGKGALVWLRDAVPPMLAALPGAARVHAGEEPPAGFPERFDAIVVLDCPGLDRTGIRAFGGDHHRRGRGVEERAAGGDPSGGVEQDAEGRWRGRGLDAPHGQRQPASACPPVHVHYPIQAA